MSGETSARSQNDFCHGLLVAVALVCCSVTCVFFAHFFRLRLKAALGRGACWEICQPCEEVEAGCSGRIRLEDPCLRQR